MLKTSLKYALLSGVFMVLIYHLSFKIGVNPQVDPGHMVFDTVLIGLFIFFGIKEYKDRFNKGILFFWQGMTIGFYIYSIATIFFILGQVLYYNFSADAVINYKEAATNLLENQKQFYIDKLGVQVYREQVKAIEERTVTGLLLDELGKKLLAGFFITPVISIILRKQPN